METSRQAVEPGGAGILARPEILAPAGCKDSFLAALAAGADAVYLGLKNFSARMEAENFGLGLLARLAGLAHAESRRVYVAMNSLLKPNELGQAYRLVRRLAGLVHADGLIVQDLAMLNIARQAGFAGRIALSTLANVSDPAGLLEARAMGADRVILPRELSLDEIRMMDAACPPGLELECFVHGALCYCVSGRCYWSSYLGGRSGLRGRCAQPCRRVYARGKTSGSRRDDDGAGRRRNARAVPEARGRRFFACQDLELAPLVKTLLATRHVVSWKIEGRKKGPHYVFHAVTAYRMLRDNGGNAQARKTALEILELALGRPGVRAGFLPQNRVQPMAPDGQTSSGLLAGKARVLQDGSCVLKPHFELLPLDYLRIGVEDESWHSTLSVSRVVPKAGSLVLRLPRHKTPRNGTPVYLIDRREPELKRLLAAWDKRLQAMPRRPVEEVADMPAMPEACRSGQRPDIVVAPGARGRKNANASEAPPSRRGMRGLWLNARAAEISRTLCGRTSFWLPPVVWPGDAEAMRKRVSRLWRDGARHFVCNAPWQRALFPAELPEDADLVAGPFCNLANGLAVEEVKKIGFAAAFASPELAARDLLALPAQSPLPLGMVLWGHWPVGISRFGLVGVNVNEPFFSPKGEAFWARDYGGSIWLYPAWRLDLVEKKRELLAAGYSFFAFMEENAPAALPEQKRPGLFNWDGALL